MYGLSLLSLHHPPCIVKYVLRTSTSAPVPRRAIHSCRALCRAASVLAMELEDQPSQKQSRMTAHVTQEELQDIRARLSRLERQFDERFRDQPIVYTYGAAGSMATPMPVQLRRLQELDDAERRHFSSLEEYERRKAEALRRDDAPRTEGTCS